MHVGSVAISGGVCARLESWKWFAWPGADSDNQYGLAGLRLSAAQQRRRIDWQPEVSFPLLINLPQSAIAPEPAGVLGYGAGYFGANQRRNPAAAVVRQGFLRIKHLGSERHSLRIGRFDAADGAEVRPSDPDVAWLKSERINQRLVASYSYVQRAFDGAQFTRTTASDNVTVTAARFVDGSFHLNANREIGAGLLYAAFTRSVAGSSFRGEVRAFGLQFVDARGLVNADNRPAAALDADRSALRISTTGAHFIGVRRTDRDAVDWVFWPAAQFGTWGRLDHRAGAIAAEGGYQRASAWRPWLRAGYYWSSGDRDPADGTHGTFFQVLAKPEDVRPIAGRILASWCAAKCTTSVSPGRRISGTTAEARSRTTSATSAGRAAVRPAWRQRRCKRRLGGDADDQLHSICGHDEGRRRGEIRVRP